MSLQMAAIVRKIDTLTHALDFDRAGLGDTLVAAAAEEIFRAMDQESSPVSGPWPALSPGYDAWKSAHYPGQPMAVLLGHMKTLEQLTGLYRITTDDIRQVYGIDADARALATWFQEGHGNQPPRPFYEFGPIVVDRLNQVVDQHFARMTR